jgi:hypothetical protein
MANLGSAYIKRWETPAEILEDPYLLREYPFGAAMRQIAATQAAHNDALNRARAALGLPTD